jgi:hypothetical protein
MLLLILLRLAENERSAPNQHKPLGWMLPFRKNLLRLLVVIYWGCLGSSLLSLLGIETIWAPWTRPCREHLNCTWQRAKVYESVHCWMYASGSSSMKSEVVAVNNVFVVALIRSWRVQSWKVACIESFIVRIQCQAWPRGRPLACLGRLISQILVHFDSGLQACKIVLWNT